MTFRTLRAEALAVRI